MSDLIKPYRPVAADDCGLLANQLESAVAAIRDLGVRIGPHSRLARAVSVLRRVGGSGEYPRGDTALLEIGNAIGLAFDFVAIARAMPILPNAEAREALARAVKGRLGGRRGTDADQALSQLRVGCALAEGGLVPRIVQSGNEKTPDFVVQVGGYEASVEIKRPVAAGGVTSGLRQAAAQAAAIKTNFSIAAIDLSDVVNTDNVQSANPFLNLSVVEGLFRRTAESLSRYVARHRATVGMDRIALLVLFANALIWDSRKAGPPISRFFAYPEVFHGAVNGLVVEPARDARRQIVRGFESLGARLVSIERANS